MEELNKDTGDIVESGGIPVGKSRKQKKHTVLIIVLIVIGLLIAAAAAGGYWYNKQAQPYKTVYFNGTYINGVNVSGMTPESIKEEIAGKCDGYVYTVKSPQREDEVITAEEVGLHYVTDDTLDKILASQNIYNWYKENQVRHEYNITASTAIDEEMYNDRIKMLRAFDDASAVPCVNAELGEYDASLGEYPIHPEVDGTVIKDKEFVVGKVKEDILMLADSVDLGEYDIFEKAEIRSDNEDILKRKQALEDFCKTTITWIERDYKIDGKLLSKWAKLNDDYTVSFDEQNVKDFVEAVANSYDTFEKPRLYHTSWGKSVYVEGGNYGITVDRDKEYQEVLSLVKERKSQKDREPVCIKKANSFVEGNDLGDNYVEVNLTKQVMNYYKDGKILITSDVVSGNINLKGRATPTGTWYVYFKQKDRTLRGPQRPDGSYDYESHVNYWMPFIYGYGLHDATWRGSFGGEIYKSNGSHGCVNLPYKIAQQLYDVIEIGTPVILYFEPEAGSNTSKSYPAIQGGVSSYVPPAAPAVPAETPAETVPETQTETVPSPNPIADGGNNIVPSPVG